LPEEGAADLGQPQPEEQAQDTSHPHFNVSISFKRKRVRVRVVHDPEDFDSTDSESELPLGDSEPPQVIAGFRRSATFTAVGEADRSPIATYICEGNTYRKFRKIKGQNPTSPIILLSCVTHQECNAMAFLSNNAMYLFGTHVPYIFFDD
jgi:hypothetical protein